MKKPFRTKELKKPVAVSMTRTEKEAVLKAAEKEGLSLSQYMLQASMHFAQA